MSGHHTVTTEHSTTSLAGLDVFVGGPIQHALRAGGFEDSLRSHLDDIHRALRDHGAEVFSAHVAERFGEKTASFSPDEVTLRDHRWMRKCDVFLPVLPADSDGLVRTDGTHIELGWASATGVPVVVATHLPLHSSASHLLKGLGRVGTVAFVDLHEVALYPMVLVRTVREIAESRRAAAAVLAR